MTINGHEHEGPYREDGEYHQVSTNDAGLSVFEILVNHQDYFNLLTGNDPYLRLIEFDPRIGQIRNKTLSPTFARFASDPSSVESAFVDLLDAFDAGMFVPILSGEDLVSAIAPFPLFPGDVAHSRAEAAAVVLDFFGVSDVEGLRSVPFSPLLTDADSQFAFDVGFDAVGRPTLAKVVAMKVYPYRCANTVRARGWYPFLPVAILGSPELSANSIDPGSLRLEGVPAYDLRVHLDVGRRAAPARVKGHRHDCDAAIRDGFHDLVVRFDRNRVVRALDKAEDERLSVLRLTANLKSEFGGHPVVGEDEVVIKY